MKGNPSTAPAPEEVDEDVVELARDLLEDVRHLTRALAAPDAPVVEPVARVVDLASQVETLTAALVGRARRGKYTWEQLSRVLRMSPETARRAFREDVISRRLQRVPRPRAHPQATRWPAAGGPPEPGAGPPAPPPTEDPPPVAARGAGSHLAPVLSTLQRSSRLSLRALGVRTRVSPSYLSRVLCGERFPSWEMTERIAHACGADPRVLRKVWEDEKLREGTPAPSTTTRTRPTDALASSLRTLHLRAGRPTPQTLTAAHGSMTLTAEQVTHILDGHTVPDWPDLRQLIYALDGEPAYFQPLWDAAYTHEPTQTIPCGTPSPSPDDRVKDMLLSFSSILSTAPTAVFTAERTAEHPFPYLPRTPPRPEPHPAPTRPASAPGCAYAAPYSELRGRKVARDKPGTVL